AERLAAPAPEEPLPAELAFAPVPEAVAAPEREPAPEPEPEPALEPEPDTTVVAPAAAPPARLRMSAPGTDERRDALAATLALLADPDPAARREAVEALAEAGEPASFLPLSERVFDPDPGVADAARDALGRHRRDPQMRPVPEKLRRALLSGISDRATAAARALGALRDVESIAGLIQTLEVSGPGPADAAADALAAITLQRLGTDARRWLVWWKGNRGRGRAEWLFAGLASDDRAVRAAAAEELAEVAPAPEGWAVDLPPEERDRAARAWASGWAKSGRVI
ncbi:MAG TPA: HEAT repeat domain-containing protein, partial [Anaeromyxobacteraceae bacterium]|nr:HEAT repeat domain-containing protein [Anaeromyxobacteraceae bacterium]